MIGLWIGAALLSGLAALLIVFRSARAGEEAVEATEDPALAVYRRQLAEIDDLAERGLLAGEEQGSARTEAARRLLTAADTAQPRPPARPSRWLVAGIAAVTPLLAAGVYIWLGSPGSPDQPFAKRLDAWGKQDPASLQPAQLVAIIKGAEPKHPNDPTLYYFLARAEIAAGDAFDAERSLHKAIDLAPNRPDLWSALGAFLIAQQQGAGEPSPQALAAFAKAQALDPDDVDSLYYLSRARIGSGDVAGGLAGWTRLVSVLKPDDQRRPIVAAQIAEVQKTGHLPVDHPQQQAASVPGADAGQQAMIQGMVDKLAAQLNAQPDDPAGWARLVRSYGVLGDKARQDAALARARTLFKDRPADLHTVEAAQSAPLEQPQ